MILLDVNVLVAFFRPDHVHHRRVVDWWDRDVSSGSVPVSAVDVAWVGFLRIVTNPRVLVQPATTDEALGFMADVRAQDHYWPFSAGGRVLDLFASECSTAQAIGNLVTDAYIAAAARSIGASVATFDRDFRRFDGLTIIEPG